MRMLGSWMRMRVSWVRVLGSWMRVLGSWVRVLGSWIGLWVLKNEAGVWWMGLPSFLCCLF
jgi:hypothetical protein